MHKIQQTLTSRSLQTSGGYNSSRVLEDYESPPDTGATSYYHPWTERDSIFFSFI